MDQGRAIHRATANDNSLTLSEAGLFARALLGKPLPPPMSTAEPSHWDRELSEFVASISNRSRDRISLAPAENVQATRDHELSKWLASISEEHDRQWRESLAHEASSREAQERYEQLLERLSYQEAEWDPAKHPRLGGPPNAGWFASTGGGRTASATSYHGSASITRDPDDEQSGELRVSSSMLRSTGWLGSVRDKLRVAGEIASAFAAGLGTGAKAVVNGLATAARSVVTLGLNTDQLELIGVTREDRERGYDTAVTISTGSGQVLIAVGTGGMASALAKGGTVARAASGALVAYDAAGNAVGVVQGVYDASQNGVTLANGVQVAASALGISANVSAAKGLVKNRPAMLVPEAPAQKAPSSTSAKDTAADVGVPQKEKISAASSSASSIDEFIASVPRKATPTRTPANRYEIEHTGPYNYTISGGGDTFDIDGYRGETILEAKHVGKPKESPYVPGSSCPAPVREVILAQTRDELRRARAIISSNATPFKNFEIITNSDDAKTFFEDLLMEMQVPGSVQLRP